jgi:hypothetical protein
MKLGRCYEHAYKYQQANKHVTLVHGEVVNPTTGSHHVHAWCEHEGNCIDVAGDKHITLPRLAYYAIGIVSNAVTYTVDEATRHALDTGHYGPWDPYLDDLQEQVMQRYFTYKREKGTKHGGRKRQK